MLNVTGNDIRFSILQYDLAALHPKLFFIDNMQTITKQSKNGFNSLLFVFSVHLMYFERKSMS